MRCQPAARNASSIAIRPAGGQRRLCLARMQAPWATPGAEFFVKNGGGITSTRPTALGSRIIKLGIARNATDLLVQIQDIGQLSST